MTTDATPVLVAVAWPYANGVQHIGHLAGCYLPADIFARYHRTAGNQVLMVSGSDAHGTPITVKADEEGVGAAEIVDRYHPRILEQWDEIGISFDLFTTTMTDNHREVTWELFRRLHDGGYLEPRTTDRFFDPQAKRFLPDRYVEGTCPHCGYEGARGDQCENCARTLDPEELIQPTSRVTGVVPELRATEHYFLLLSELQDEVAAWLETREGWRPHVINWARGFVGEGLKDRPITRDLDWGVPIPPELDISTEDSEKRIYVWFEAVIGYLSAAKEWATHGDDPDAWTTWWQRPDAATYYFVGKDNIPFHTVIWPAQLMAFNQAEGEALNLPTDVPANQYVTFKGEKASKSRGVGTPVLDYLGDGYEPDALRYAVAANLPEQQDTDISEAELVRRINDELVATWGNLVNRVFAMTSKHFDDVVPEPGELDSDDRDLLADVDDVLDAEADLIEDVRLRAGLHEALRGAQATNAYLNRKEPWQTAKDDRRRTGTTLFVALNAINGLKTAFSPYLPFTSQRLHEALGGTGEVAAGGWDRTPLETGTPLAPTGPLFTKMDLPE